MGRDDEAHLPDCGCDACDESVEDCAERLLDFVKAVTGGTFGERLVRDGGWLHEYWYRTDDAGWSQRTPINRSQRKALRTALPGGELRWAPWILRE
jgi:hypothetical protein